MVAGCKELIAEPGARGSDFDMLISTNTGNSGERIREHLGTVVNVVGNMEPLNGTEHDGRDA